MNELRDLYEEVILEHNRNPRNYGRRPEPCSHSARGNNPLCGDVVQVHLRVADGVIVDAAFDGEGCAISTASASMMTQATKGKSVEEANALFDRVRALLTTGAGCEEGLGKLAVLGGVKEFPMRVKCATLPWHTLVAALAAGSGEVTTE